MKDRNGGGRRTEDGERKRGFRFRRQDWPDAQPSPRAQRLSSLHSLPVSVSRFLFSLL